MRYSLYRRTFRNMLRAVVWGGCNMFDMEKYEKVQSSDTFTGLPNLAST